MAQTLDNLAAAGVSVWLDDLSRPRILSGSLARMVDEGEIVRHHHQSDDLRQGD